MVLCYSYAFNGLAWLYLWIC